MTILCPYCFESDCPHWIGQTTVAKDGMPIAPRPGVQAQAFVEADDSCLFTDEGIRVYRRVARASGALREKRKKKAM